MKKVDYATPTNVDYVTPTNTALVKQSEEQRFAVRTVDDIDVYKETCEVEAEYIVNLPYRAMSSGGGFRIHVDELRQYQWHRIADVFLKKYPSGVAYWTSVSEFLRDPIGLDCWPIDYDCSNQLKELYIKAYNVPVAGVDLSGVSINNMDYSGSDFSHANFTKAVFHHCNFNETNLEYANFSGAEIVDCKFENSFIRHANFDSVGFSNADFYQADGKNAVFSNIYCCKHPANFISADLENANFKNADLRLVKFYTAILHNTNFSNANIINAQFQGAYRKSKDADLIGWEIAVDVYSKEVMIPAQPKCRKPAAQIAKERACVSDKNLAERTLSCRK